MIICSVCGAETPRQRRFCLHCGTSLNAPTVPTVPSVPSVPSFPPGYDPRASDGYGASPRRPGVVLLGVAVGLVVLLAGASFILLRQHGDSALATPTASPSAGAGIATDGETPVSTDAGDVQPTPSPSDPTIAQVTGSSDGLVTFDAGGRAAADVATAVVNSLDTYYAAINRHDLPTAYAMYGPQQQAKAPYQRWSAGVSSSSISEVVVTGLSGATSGIGPGPVVADVGFVSRQPPALGPVPGQACTRWTLRYSLIPDQTGTGYLIDGAKSPSGRAFTAC